MRSDDPFALPEDEGTVIRPAPGGRRPLAPATFTTQPAPSLSTEELSRIASLNPLLSAANPLLTLAVQLRSAPVATDLERLRETLVRAVHEFEVNAKARNLRSEVVLAARYCLCTFLDEVVATTPWGGAAWGSRSLLVTFHNESWGGEKFFALVKRVSDQAAGNVDLLELMYVILAFGFQGRYRMADGGRGQLEDLRERLLLLIRGQRGEPETQLSPSWHAAIEKRAALTSYMPLWVATVGAAGVLLVVYVVLSWLLTQTAEPVYAKLHDIPDKFAPAPPKPVAAKPTGLAAFLQPEIAAGRVAVSELPDRTIVRIRGDKLFDSGSAQINPNYLPVLQRIGQALNNTEGAVVITGHTDNRRIISARFPSNWDLSNARAEAVVQVLAGAMSLPGRIRAEGRADREPIASNDTAESRAQNRRVDITVFTAALPRAADLPYRPASVQR